VIYSVISYKPYLQTHFFVKIYLFIQPSMTKSKNTTTKTNKKIQTCRRRALKTGPLAPKADALPLHHRVKFSQLRVTIVVEPFNCYYAMVRKRKETKPNLRATHFQQIIFSVII